MVISPVADRRRSDGVVLQMRQIGRMTLASLLVVTSVSLTRTDARQPPADEGWRQFRGNPQLTGVAPSTLPATLKVLWTYDAGDSIESSAAIADGSVYVGAQGGALHSLSLQDGSLRWKYAVKDGIGESSPAVHDGLVYVGDLAGTVHAVGAGDGKAAWTFATKGEIKASPVVSDGKVLIGSYDGQFYGLDAKSGKQVWTVVTEGPVHATAAIANGVAYITGCDEMLRAIRVSDGKELFTMSSGAYTGASPALVGEAAYYGTFNNDVLKADLKARKLVWRYTHPQRQFPFYSSAAVANGTVVLGGRDKMVHALDAATGKARWTFATNARVESSAVVAGGRVYIGSNDGRLYVFDLAKGSKLFEFNAGGPLSASPAVSGGRLVIGSQDGTLYCLG